MRRRAASWKRDSKSGNCESMIDCASELRNRRDTRRARDAEKRREHRAHLAMITAVALKCSGDGHEAQATQQISGKQGGRKKESSRDQGRRTDLSTSVWKPQKAARSDLRFARSCVRFASVFSSTT